ncbi:hypothetical protein MSAN_02298100 [Mycena sanguinolenta]|uniref:Uncharacterized protein n=1 Tax=Mycena sanguinolenta TaxID=230812 RepID=A0A8H6X9A9_9AGAR|nr:hypothetical protein MSAN_02298100 [Mycena sanguinolenta]
MVRFVEFKYITWNVHQALRTVQFPASELLSTSNIMAYATRYPSSAQQQPTFTSPIRRRLPFEQYRPPQWHNASRQGQVHRPVCFDYPGQTRQGVSMRDLPLRGASTPIQGANDLVLAHTGLQRVVFRIIWPGYGHVEWCRTIPVTHSNGAPITRAALGFQIASNFVRFVEKSDYETPTSRDWMISPNCVRFEHLYLVALHNTSDDVWQADVALDLS